MERHAVINQYPMWVYITLAVIAIFGLVYSVPNIYGDVPAVQISGASARVTVNTTVLDRIKSSLDAEKLPYRSAELEDSTILVRFADTNQQLSAKIAIKKTLGNDYTVALNLAPATPHWLEALGAAPMKLGLDLRGGVHFLLAVDVNSALERRMESDMRAISAELRKEKVRYSGINLLKKKQQIIIRFRDADAVAKAESILKWRYGGLQFKQILKEGKFQLQAIMTPSEQVKANQYTMEQTMTVLRNRVNELGIAEPVVQQQGTDRVSVDLPGIQDAAEAKQILGGTATLEFHLVDDEHSLENAVQGHVPVGSRLFHMSEGTAPILLKKRLLLSGTSIISATSSFGEEGTPQVNIRVGGSSVSLFNRVTRDNKGKRMAIVYVETKSEIKTVKGKNVTSSVKTERVISAPTIQSALGTSFRITGIGNAQEAGRLALLLRAGALPANMTIIEESTVGPSLGKDNIDKGMISIAVGFILIVIFMALYYGVFGLFADVALLFNLVLIVAVMSVLGATLTLPGIAGIVLTVGMAVDANVLINERIREELRNGVTPQAAIHAGYARAFGTIVDANVTTLIVALVLFGIGTGPVKGFAVTLIIGLLTSMFTAITGTRALVNLLYGRKQVSKIHIGI